METSTGIIQLNQMKMQPTKTTIKREKKIYQNYQLNGVLFHKIKEKINLNENVVI